MKIGVLALQGGFKEHIDHIKSLGYQAVEVRKKEDLDGIDGIILPGGESTTMGRLLRVTGLKEVLREKIINGLPVWGTCAGMILLAKDIDGADSPHLSLMDITVKRNAYGTQIDSFSKPVHLDILGEKPLDLVFIRAPYVSSLNITNNFLDDSDGMHFANDNWIIKLDKHIVGIKEGNMIATSFHPELTPDTRFHKYFIEEIVSGNRCMAQY